MLRKKTIGGRSEKAAICKLGSEASGETGPAATFISDFSLQSCAKITLCGVGHLVCGTLLSLQALQGLPSLTLQLPGKTGPIPSHCSRNSCASVWDTDIKARCLSSWCLCHSGLDIGCLSPTSPHPLQMLGLHGSPEDFPVPARLQAPLAHPPAPPPPLPWLAAQVSLTHVSVLPAHLGEGCLSFIFVFPEPGTALGTGPGTQHAVRIS